MNRRTGAAGIWDSLVYQRSCRTVAAQTHSAGSSCRHALAGTVEASSYPGIAVGDRVVANSWGLSQTHHGGYAQKARVKGEWLVKIPAPFSTKDAMAIGTAGYTAMLSVLALEHGGLTPQR